MAWENLEEEIADEFLGAQHITVEDLRTSRWFLDTVRKKNNLLAAQKYLYLNRDAHNDRQRARDRAKAKEAREAAGLEATDHERRLRLKSLGTEERHRQRRLRDRDLQRAKRKAAREAAGLPVSGPELRALKAMSPDERRARRRAQNNASYKRKKALARQA